MKNIRLFIILLLSFCGIQMSLAEDKIIPLTAFTHDGDTYEVTGLDGLKAKKFSAIYVEMPNGTTSGKIGFLCSGNQDDRYIYIHGNGGTKKDESRKAVMSKKDYEYIDYTSDDIAAKDNSYYLVFSTEDDFKINAIKYTATGGGVTPQLSSDATLKSLTYYSDGQYVSVPGFSKDVLDYVVDLPATYAGGAPSIQAEATHANASLDVAQATSLSETAKVKVTAEDGETTLTYTVQFHKNDGYPYITGFTFDNQKGEAVIDQEAIPNDETGTITAEIKHGFPLTAITPNFTGKNIANLYPTGAQDFSNGPVNYIISSPDGPVAIFDVTITEADAVLPSSVTVSPSTLNLTEGESATLTATVLPNDADNKNVTWSSNDESVAKVDANGTVTAVAEGETTITVTTVEGAHSATCSVTVKAKAPLPVTGLTAHAPEIYEEPKDNGGYGGTLSTFNNSDYEVYYICRDPSGDNISVAVEPGDKVAGITTGTSTTVKAKDNWFELKSSQGKGGDTNASAKDEFKSSSIQCVKMQDGDEFVFQVKGFDQFNFYGNDNSKDVSKGRYFTVYVDDSEIYREGQTSVAPLEGYAIHRYAISTEEHVIRLVAVGTQNSKLNGFSFRVANIPLVRHKDGQKDQTVYQTKDMERVTFLVRRTDNYRLSWKNDKAINGIQLVPGQGDTVYLQGTADAAAGKYTYSLEALDGNGNVASSESGVITVETHIFDSRNNNQTTNIAEAIKPINFVYYALSSDGITLDTDITGLSLSFSNDSICTLEGTPDVSTTEGDHTYSISIAGGNTVTGTITIVVPDPIFGPIADAQVRDGQEITFTVEVHHAKSVSQSGLPVGFTVEYDEATDLATVSGTPNWGGAYPRTFNYTLTATPRYTGRQEASAQGKLIVIDPNAKAVLVVHKDLLSEEKDPVAAYLANQNYAISMRTQSELGGSSTEAFDLIVISANADADNEAVLTLIQTTDKPLLNLNGFTYSPNRLGWGEPYNGTVSEANADKIYVQRAEHPIFQNWKTQGSQVRIFDTYEGKGVMPILVNVDSTFCLATAYTRDIEVYENDGELQTVLHEIPANGTLRTAKYICFPIANSITLSSDGRTLVKAIVDYLLSTEQAELEMPELQINSFTLGGKAAEIDQEENTITLALTDVEFIGLDSLRAAAPQITLQDPDLTHIVPAADKLVDFRFGDVLPVAYTVTDYIHRRVYEVSIDITYTQGIEESYESGEWVNIYDIFGRMITTTNEDIRTMALPQGIYIIVRENGQTIKIMR